MGNSQCIPKRAPRLACTSTVSSPTADFSTDDVRIGDYLPAKADLANEKDSHRHDVRFGGSRSNSKTTRCDIRLTDHQQHMNNRHPAPMQDSTVSASLSLTCEGQTNGKKWSFQIGNVNDGLSHEELGSMMESIQQAIAATLPVRHASNDRHTVAEQADQLHHMPTMADDTTISVVSRDSGVPGDHDPAFPPPYRSPTKANHVPQAVILNTLCENQDLLKNGRRKSESQQSPPEPSKAERQCESPGDVKIVHCSRCRRLVRMRKRAEKHKDKVDVPAKPQRKVSLTLTSVQQDVVEDYLTYKFRSKSSEEEEEERPEQCDTKSLTFSEYMGGSGEKEQRRRKSRDSGSSRRARRDHCHGRQAEL
eukprot:scpid49795/ scgid1296/ 